MSLFVRRCEIAMTEILCWGSVGSHRKVGPSGTPEAVFHSQGLRARERVSISKESRRGAQTAGAFHSEDGEQRVYCLCLCITTRERYSL